MVFSSAFGTSVYAPGIPQVAKEMGVSIEVATLGISLYSLGLGNNHSALYQLIDS